MRTRVSLLSPMAMFAAIANMGSRAKRPSGQIALSPSKRLNWLALQRLNARQKRESRGGRKEEAAQSVSGSILAGRKWTLVCPAPALSFNGGQH